jgi:nucleotide-binding universal stress UspA family protein
MPEIKDVQPRVTPGTPSAASLRLVTGYDGSPPASRAIEAATTLLRGRHGSIDIVYVTHAPGVDMLSPDALVQVEAGFSEMEKKLRSSAAAQLDGRGVAWELQRRHGMIARELIAAASAVGEAHPGDTVAIVVGSSSQASHRIVGSVAVGLARHCPVPLVIVP